MDKNKVKIDAEVWRAFVSMCEEQNISVNNFLAILLLNYFFEKDLKKFDLSHNFISARDN